MWKCHFWKVTVVEVLLYGSGRTFIVVQVFKLLETWKPLALLVSITVGRKPAMESLDFSGGSSAAGVEDICDQCQGEAKVFCQQCKNSYCSNCSRVRHRAGKRKTHTISRLSIIPDVAHVSIDEKEACELASRGMYCH